MQTLKTQALIIGGGSTGTGLARDLALRGVKCLLAEKRDINAGASGGNHGLLHSGARYVASDMEAAIECREEGDILRKVAPQCIEDTGGLFVAVPGDNEEYIANFPAMCERSNIPFREIDPAEALRLEPCLNPDITAAYEVQDGAIDPFMLSLDSLADAQAHGTEVRRNAMATAFIMNNGRIERTRFRDLTNGSEFEVEAEIVLNAAGAWAGLVAKLAGSKINILYSSGTLIITQDRLARRVVNRLRKAADADILVPGGTVSVLGTTSVTVDAPDQSRPTVAEVDHIIEDARSMMPVLESTRYIRAYSGVRPLVLAGEGGDGRSVSRGFSLVDHADDGIENFVTITGGKLTTYRLMAEKTADLACAKLGVDAPCVTRTRPMPASASGCWTEPGRAPKNWIDSRNQDDLILCECEMVSRQVVDSIVSEMGDMRGRSMLKAIGLRSRVGKGPCQGGFCGLRITSHLYDSGIFEGERGLAELGTFIERRWRGFSPMLWNLPLKQSELQEALYCGMLDMELNESASEMDDTPFNMPETGVDGGVL